MIPLAGAGAMWPPAPLPEAEDTSVGIVLFGVTIAIMGLVLMVIFLPIMAIYGLGRQIAKGCRRLLIRA